jgi:hypothetical protein
MSDQPTPTVRQFAEQVARQITQTILERSDALVDHAPRQVLAGLELVIDPPPVSWHHSDGDEWTVETDPETDRPIAARRSRWLPGGRFEVTTYVGGTQVDRTVLDPP